MIQFLLQKRYSEKLQGFTHIIEVAIKKKDAVQPNFFNENTPNRIRINNIFEGRFEWAMNEPDHILYSGDLVLIHRYKNQNY